MKAIYFGLLVTIIIVASSTAVVLMMDVPEPQPKSNVITVSNETISGGRSYYPNDEIFRETVNRYIFTGVTLCGNNRYSVHIAEVHWYDTGSAYVVDNIYNTDIWGRVTIVITGYTLQVSNPNLETNTVQIVVL